MKLSSLLDRAVVTESGERLGRAFEFHARLDGNEIELTAIVVGRRGFLERLGVVGVRAGRKEGAIPWESVVRIGPKTITVRDDAVTD
jgi:sporulation protein YlmC with PRC-barrel domain